MLKNNKPPVIVVFGPTASGKTNLSIEIAKKLSGQIISADSMQIYKKLDVGTAKATKEEQAEIKHHLIDICEISDVFSVAEYKKICYEKIDEVLNQNQTPIIVGGTGLYINSVVNNMRFDDEKLEENKENIREDLNQLANEKGKEYLHDMLRKLDPVSAEKIHVNNVRRVIRAIEVAKQGKTKKSIDDRNDLWNKNESDYRFITVYIDVQRDILKDKINARIDAMIQDGIVEEAKMLKEMNLDKNNTALQAIGYKEFFDYIDGKESLKQAVDKLKQGTKRYAKRQQTWFKKLGADIVFNSDMTNEMLIDEIKRMMYESKE